MAELEDVTILLNFFASELVFFYFRGAVASERLAPGIEFQRSINRWNTNGRAPEKVSLK
jgi:hypothetical protein